VPHTKSLKDKIKALRSQKDILLMPHLVLGYPSYEENEKIIAAMINAGAEIIELQIPFSEPMADGPVILRANDKALKAGANTTKSLAFTQKLKAQYPDTIFIFMTYYNVIFAYGIDRFFEASKGAGIEALIVPDLPPEEGADYLDACTRYEIASIYLFTPTQTNERLATIAHYAKGMAYCVGRKGVTGIKTQMDQSTLDLIERYKKATDLPIGLGFGIQCKEDVTALIGHADVAIIGTQLFIEYDRGGAEAVGRFLQNMRT
jgi:tryptophan synthase alpha chain